MALAMLCERGEKRVSEVIIVGTHMFFKFLFLRKDYTFMDRSCAVPPKWHVLLYVSDPGTE